MHKKLIIAGVLFGVLVFGILAAFMAADTLLDSLTLKAITLLTSPESGAQATVKNVTYGEIETKLFRAIAWQDLGADLNLAGKSEILPNASLTLQIAKVELQLTDLAAKKITVVASGISIAPLGKTQITNELPEMQTTLLQDGKLTIPVQLTSWSPAVIRQQVKDLIHEGAELARSGTTALPLTFTGNSQFTINGDPITVKLFIRRENERGALTIDSESLQAVSTHLREELTPAEIELLTKNPFKTPTLLQIRNEAQKTAKAEHEKTASVPEDAYRHVLWSYLLTKSYGPEFAQQVTDAHELGATNNSEADHRMDYKNNEVGRRYAQQQYRRAELLSRLLKDPEVIQTPR